MRRKGFTFLEFFIELLVVFAIVCFSLSIFYVIVKNAKIKTRDTERMVELRQIRNALELFYTDNNFYPDYGSGSLPSCGGFAGYYADYIECWEDLEEKLKPYIELPRDPRSGVSGGPDRTYWYKNKKGGLGYILLMNPEDKDLLDGDENCYSDMEPDYYCIGNR
jgi:type II secretory pathway pseudopilin PulG